MLKTHLEKLAQKESLREEDMREAMSHLMSGQEDECDVISFLTLLRDKGESKAEIVGAVRVLREKSITVDNKSLKTVDTCGTGGDGQGTFNISTASAFVVAGAGVNVAKHGNRSVSSKCGSADVLEALGVPIHLKPEEVISSIQSHHFGFFFAPDYHPAMKLVAEARKKIGTRTIFNLLGPLINPITPSFQVMGLYDRNKMTLVAEVLRDLKIERAFLVHGNDGLDEVTLTGKSYLVEVNGNHITESELDPKEYGFSYCLGDELKGKDLDDNVTKMKALLGGYVFPLRDAVVLNSALAFLAYGRVRQLEEGIVLANHSLDQGKALQVLEKVKKVE